MSYVTTIRSVAQRVLDGRRRVRPLVHTLFSHVGGFVGNYRTERPQEVSDVPPASLPNRRSPENYAGNVFTIFSGRSFKLRLDESFDLFVWDPFFFFFNSSDWRNIMANWPRHQSLSNRLGVVAASWYNKHQGCRRFITRSATKEQKQAESSATVMEFKGWKLRLLNNEDLLQFSAWRENFLKIQQNSNKGKTSVFFFNVQCVGDV